MKQWTFPSNPQNDEFITVVCLVQMRRLNLLISPNKFLAFLLSTLLFRCVVSLRCKDPKSFSWHQKLNRSEQALVSAGLHWHTKLFILQQHSSIVDKLRMLLVSLLCTK